jgi:hypothetical protein
MTMARSEIGKDACLEPEGKEARLEGGWEYRKFYLSGQGP